MEKKLNVQRILPWEVREHGTLLTAFHNEEDADTYLFWRLRSNNMYKVLQSARFDTTEYPYEVWYTDDVACYYCAAFSNKWEAHAYIDNMV